MTAESRDRRQTRSWRGAELVLPPVAMLPRIAPTIARPAALRLPIDVPQAEQATLGGVIATNWSGSRRLGCGTMRDYVIGISAIDASGQRFSAGGRVVKNVAGYDAVRSFWVFRLHQEGVAGRTLYGHELHGVLL